MGGVAVVPFWAHAALTDVVFDGSGTSSVGGHGALAAEAEFKLNLNSDSGLNTIDVILTNTVSPHVFEPADLLSALIFQFDNSTVLTNTNQHVFVTAGSSLTDSSHPSNIDKGYEFLTVSGTSFGMTGNAFGFSSAGLGLFGSSNFKDNAGTGLGGSDYNITHGGNPLHGSPGSPLVDHSVTFTLNAANVLDLSHLDKVAFQYGTDISEGYTTGHTKVLTPEPVTSSLAAASALAFIRRRNRRKTTS